MSSAALPYVKVLENGKFTLDLKGIKRPAAHQSGAGEEHIAVCQDCTACMREKVLEPPAHGHQPGLHGGGHPAAVSVRRTATLLLAAALAFSLWGCTAGETEPTPSASPEPTPSQQVQTLPFALAYDPTASLHPITSQSQVNLDLAGLVYEGLYELDRNFEPQPVLARSAAVSGDGLSWTITLDSGARFSDGTLVTAQHVADSLNAARASALYGGRLSAVSEVTASESGAVVITLSSPNGALDALLDNPHRAGAGEWHPPGDGALPLFLRDRGELCLSINGNYRQALPYDTIPLREVRGAEERIAAFDSGEVTAAVTDFSSAYALGYSGTYEACDFPTTTLLYVGSGPAEESAPPPGCARPFPGPLTGRP